MTDGHAKGDHDKNETWRGQLDAETHNTTELDAESAAGRFVIPGLTLLWHPDFRRVGERVALPELSSRGSVELSRVSPDFTAPGQGEPRPLADGHISRTPIRLVGTDDGVRIERGSHGGRVSVDGEPLEAERKIQRSELDEGVIVVLSAYVALLLHWLDPAPTALPRFDLVGESTAMVRLRREIKRVIRLDVPVLLRGETGTGKELVARAIHGSGPRAERECVTVNMAAIPASLAASELFGAAKGAFTGADRHKIGFFQRAEGGTLFLDEIGETPSEVQALLLRALESHEIQPVGAVSVKPVDVRVIAATDADLDSAVAAGEFRAPLLHRLAGYEIRLPPLRKRRDDVARLLTSFLGRESASLESTVDPVAVLPLPLMVSLVAFHWPGNVRQLRNVARRLAILGQEPAQDLRANVEEVLGEVLPERLQRWESLPRDGVPVSGSDTRPETAVRVRKVYRKPSEVEQQELIAVLKKHAWHLKPAAEELGVSRASLYLMVEACDAIRKASDLTRDDIQTALSAAGGNIAEASRRLEVSEQGLKRRMTQLGLR